LHREQVVVIPGGAFGPSGERCIRLALTVDDSRLKEALSFLR
jgi:aspartate/methionine/tyrosine aminotransferase